MMVKLDAAWWFKLVAAPSWAHSCMVENPRFVLDKKHPSYLSV